MWIISFLKPYLWVVCGFIALILFIVAVELSVPKFIQYFIDHLLPGRKVKPYIEGLGVVALLVLLMIGATVLRNRLQRVIQEKASRDLQFALFEHLRKLGLSYYLIGPYFEKRAAELGRETQKQRSDFHKKMYDTVSALLELRVYRGKDWDLEQGQTKQMRMHQTINKLHFMAYSRGLVRRVSVQFGAVAVFAYGAYLLKQGSVTTGALVAFMFYYFRMMQDITYIVTMTSEQKVLMNQVEKLVEFIHEKPEVEESEAPLQLSSIQGHLSFNRLYFRYPEQAELLQNISLDIRSGEKIAFVGTSGNGKSTLLKLIGRFYDPDQGEIRLDGIPLKQLALQQIRESMGFVFQETYLFGTSIRENIRFGRPDATEEEVIDAAKAACAHDFIQQFPQGYDTYVGERGVKLSGGQQQRISIARMLIKNPRILLLDEATSALDNVSEAEVQQALQRLFAGRTIVAVAHRLSTVRDFDRIIVLEHGTIAEMGTYNELMKRQGAFYRLAQGEEEAVS